MYRKQFTSLLALLAACALFAAPGWSGGVAFISAEGSTYLAERDVSTPEAAIVALLAGPTKEELLKGVTSAIPKGTKLISFDALDNGAVINLSAKAAEGFDDVANENIFTQALWTMRQFGLEEQVRILIDGNEVTNYLPAQSPALYAAPADGQKSASKIELSDVGLSGKRITVTPGHGWYWNGSGWYLERGISCGIEQEDLRMVRNCKYLKAHLEGDSAYVQMTRETDLNRGTGPSGHPYWQEGAYIWLRDQAYACTIWAYSSGRCSDIVGGTRLSDSINSKPRASNLDSRGNTDLLVDIHTNAYTGNCYGTGCPSGTDGFYTDNLGHEAWAAQSISLAQWIQDGHIAAAQAAGFSYGHHGSTGALYGNFASTRTAQRPAALIEMGFHDSCDTDAPKLADPFFQDVGAWGIYNGICGYFGNTPTYGMYSSEFVSDTVPASMTCGQVVNAQITFRNKAVRWDEAHAFRLGGGADAFTAQNRLYISGVVENGETYTFDVTLTAPSTPGTYNTSWMMVREWYAWFGPQFSENIQVVSANPPYNFDAGTDGWVAGNSVVAPWWTNCCGWPGILVVDQNGNDAFIYGPATSFTGASNHAMLVRIYCQNGVNPSHDMQMFFTTAAEPYWDAPKSSPVAYYTSQDYWTDVYLTLGTNAKWNGQTITGLRLDFDNTNQGNRYLIDSISLSTIPATATPTNTPVPPTSTPTNTPTRTPTNTPTNTPVPPTNTPTNTPVPPTSTPTNTPTNTPVPPTSTPTNTPTNTPVPPTSTPTNTPVPPTSTPTNTPVPPTSTPTNTPVPPTSTPTNTPSAPTFIVDNVDAGYSEVTGSSSWFGSSSSTDKYGADYRYNTTGTGLDYATWQVTISAVGYYDVSVWYPQGSNRPTNAPYTVYYSGGSQTFPVNQTTGGGQWILLGSFPFQAGGFSVVETDNADAGKALQADAVKWEWTAVQPTSTPTNTPTYTFTNTNTPTNTPTRTPVPDIIIDDGDASFTKGSTWTYSTTANGCLNNDYYWASTYTGTYNRWAKWTPSIPVTGNYAVYAMWKSGSNRATDSPYTVNYNGGSQTVDKNQSATGGSWQLLGTYNFAAGTSGWIELRDGPAVGSKVVIADGIKFVHQP